MAPGKQEFDIRMNQRFAHDVQGDMTGTAGDFPQDLLKCIRMHKSPGSGALQTEAAGQVAVVGDLNIYFF